MSVSPTVAPPAAARAVPRLGFLGVGWIGRHRLLALAASGAGEVAAVADTAPARLRTVLELTGDRAATAETLDELLDMGLDGIVIATPSALHAEQTISALERGAAVFCQKPLARTAAETTSVIDAARAADRLLGVDLSYRSTAAMRAVREAVQGGEIGQVLAADLVFHNAYGPDAGWARDAALSGGGCVIDLGTHLVDLALWILGRPRVERVSSQLFAQGRRLGVAASATASECEDLAFATLELSTGAIVRLVCSWESSPGRDAIIEATFHGTLGSAAMRNLNGSFHDFTAELYQRTACRTLAMPPDDWGGRALVTWSRRLAESARYDPAIETVTDVAAVLDAVLGR